MSDLLQGQKASANSPGASRIPPQGALTEVGTSLVRVFGYVSLEAAAILERLQGQGPLSLAALPGEYAIAVDQPEQTVIATSSHGFEPYYYVQVGDRIHHGPTVLEVAEAAGLPWEFDFRALSEVIALEHVLGESTLHARVKRVPQATVLVFRDGRLSLTRRPFDELHPFSPAQPKDVLDALQEEVSRWLKPDTVVALSAGFDSRVLLASALRLGHRPPLVTMGNSDSTDVQVARAIAAKLGISLGEVTLSAEEYLEHGPAIAALTGGTKLAWHWHSYLFPRKSGLGSQQTMLVGTNGEWVRTDNFNLGALAYVVDRLPSGPAHQVFWALRQSALFSPQELTWLNDDLAQELRTPALAMGRRLSAVCPGGFLDGLDRFFLEERVRHFHAEGMRLYGASCQPRLPFLGRDWVSRARGLPRSWRLGSNWHRYAIKENYPALLEFPEGAVFPQVAERAPFLYWLRTGLAHPVPYANYDQWFRGAPILNYLRDQSSLLAPVMESRLVNSVVDQQEQRGGRNKVIALLLTLTCLMSAVKAKPGL